MPWRGIFVVTVGLLTSGCILSAYQIASWSVTGVSYVFSGKGLGDHALSLATSKDCATLRILQAREICVDYGADFEDSWSALASTWGVPDALRQSEDVADAGRVETPVDPGALIAFGADSAEYPELAGETLAVQAAAMTVQLDATPPDADVTQPGLDFKGLVGGLVEPWRPVAPEDGDAPWLVSTADPPALDFGGLMPGGSALEPVSATRVAMPELRKVTSATAVLPGHPAIYLVLGSFRDGANAEALRTRHAKRNLVVTKLLADDRAIFRVLAGPIAATALTEARVDIAKAGIRNAWAVRLCSGSLAPLPCEPVLQQASLPTRYTKLH